MIPEKICHKQELLMLKEKVFAPVCQQSMHKRASDIPC